jgi:hypothetical protein
MRTASSYVVIALVGSLAGCEVRAAPYSSTRREARSCPSTHHWDRDRCVENRRDHHDDDDDRDRDRH